MNKLAYTIGVISFAWFRCIGCWLWTGNYLHLLCCLLTWYSFVPHQQHICHCCYLICLIPACWFLLWTGHGSSYLFPGYLFPALFANHILICFMSAAYVSSLSSSLHFRSVGWLWTDLCSGFILRVTVC